MEKGRKNENTREEKSREGVEMTRNMRKKKRGEKTESNGREKVFYL